MGDFFFVVKCFVVTIALIFLMQIKVGSHTVEHHSMAWLHQSPVAENLRMVANGAIHLFKKGSDATTEFIDKNAGRVLGETSE
jgi:hypothetical protein